MALTGRPPHGCGHAALLAEVQVVNQVQIRERMLRLAQEPGIWNYPREKLKRILVETIPGLSVAHGDIVRFK